MLTSAKIDIDSIVNKQLPTLSASAMRVATLAQDFNSSTRAVADAIGTDPGLAARILRTANSPLYSFERQVTTLPNAVTAVGMQTVYLLATLSATNDAFANEVKNSEIGNAIWEHSLSVAITSKELMTTLGLRGGEEAFICGLLHDIGKLLLLKHDVRLYSEIKFKVNEMEMLDFEKEMFGYTHSQIGALVAQRWGLPEQISHVIFNHHQPSEAGQYMLMARVIDIADMLSNRAGKGLRWEEECNLMATESVIALDLTEEKLEKVWEKVPAALAEMTQTYC